MLLEDEFGTINLIVPPKVYERDRVVVRAEPLVVAEGVLERHASAGGAINLVCRRLVRLDASGHLQARPAAEVVELVREEAQQAAVGAGEELAATGTGDFRAVAPAAQSFASGRRR